MQEAVVAVGTRVCVTSYGPFRRLIGTVQTVDTICVENDRYEFYQIELEGVQVKDPLWFERDEFILYPDLSG
jgi:hypothetical protein